MAANVGTFDRIARVLVGIALIALALGYVPDYQTNWGWVGIVPLATGLFGNCPVYSLFGISTCST